MEGWGSLFYLIINLRLCIFVHNEQQIHTFKLVYYHYCRFYLSSIDINGNLNYTYGKTGEEKNNKTYTRNTITKNNRR